MKGFESTETQLAEGLKSFIQSKWADLPHGPLFLPEWVGALVDYALGQGASDLHFQATLYGVTVRMRRDGQLYELYQFDPSLQGQLANHLKVLLGMDLGESRLPQTGRFSLGLSSGPGGVGAVEVRGSLLPSLWGESVALRFLVGSSPGVPADLEGLGLPAAVLADYRARIRSAAGLMAVVGPTGAGKTTTVHAGLGELAALGLKVITLEDPVEYPLNFAVQVNVRDSLGVSFASGLRAVLRQAPEVLLVGEIRDAGTADLVFQAALSGHSIGTTFHAPCALRGLLRLRYWGIPPSSLALGLQGILAQRLLPQNCPACVKPCDGNLQGWPPEFLLKRNNLDEGRVLQRGQGCPECLYTGRKGRCAVFEYLPITPELAQALYHQLPLEQLQGIAQAQGFVPLRESAWQLACAGKVPPEAAFSV